LIIGVGIDLVDLDEFRDRLSDTVIRELFLPEEIEYSSSRARPWESYAVRFAAKEAAFKALGAGRAQGLAWKDIEVVRDANGVVGLRLTGSAGALADKRGVTGSLVSLTHTRRTAAAVVVLESGGEGLSDHPRGTP